MYGYPESGDKSHPNMESTHQAKIGPPQTASDAYSRQHRTSSRTTLSPYGRAADANSVAVGCMQLSHSKDDMLDNWDPLA